MSITLLVPILERIAAALEERNAHERREARRSRRAKTKQLAMMERVTSKIDEQGAATAPLVAPPITRKPS